VIANYTPLNYSDGRAKVTQVSCPREDLERSLRCLQHSFQDSRFSKYALKEKLAGETVEGLSERGDRRARKVEGLSERGDRRARKVDGLSERGDRRIQRRNVGEAGERRRRQQKNFEPAINQD
jgi:hypothetical protein